MHRLPAGTILCVCAALIWPAAVTAHGGHGHDFGGGWSSQSESTGQPTPAASATSTSVSAPAVRAASESHGNSAAAHEHAAARAAVGGREGQLEVGHSPKENQSGEGGLRNSNRPVGGGSASGSGSSGSGSGSSGSGSSSGSSSPPVSVPTVTLPKTNPNSSTSHASSGTPAAAASVAQAPASAPAASSPAPTATPAAATTPASASPSVTGSGAQSATLGAHSHRHRGAGGRSHPAAIATSLGPGAPVTGAVAAAATAAATRGTAVATAPARSHLINRNPSSSSSSGLTPAIRTVERIANVVPRGIWILMGLLGALVGVLAGGSWLASRRANRLERQRGYLAEEVGLLQAALLPAIPERFGPVMASVAYRPAEGPAAGGDFYDLFALEDGRVAVIVGDISGHGPAALPQTALIRYTLRTYLDAGLIPRAALHAAAVTLDHQLDGSFATVVLAIYDPADRTLTYACAGHPPPLVLAPEPVEPILAGAAPPIGAGMPTGTRQTVLELPAGTDVCFFTDGIVEARAGGELYGAERLTATLVALGHKATAKEVLDRVVATTDRRPDDMAAALLHLDGARVLKARTTNGNGASAASIARTEELEIDHAALASDRVKRFLEACGLPAARVAEALGAASVVVDSAGEAVLRLHLGRGPVEIEVLPHNTGVLHLAKHAEPNREAQLTGDR
jgi:hypothetical protein